MSNTVTVNEPHTPEDVVVLTSGKVLEHGLYPNPDHHRGQPAGQLGTAMVAGYTRRAVLAADWKVWVRVDGAYGPTGDWFHARSAENFRADPAPGDTRCDRCGDESNSAPGLTCGRVDDDTPAAEPCTGTYRTVVAA